MTRDDRHELRHRVQEQARRMRRAEQERESILAQATQLGVLGLVFVLPVVGGAYLGRWLDSLVEGYSVRWTVSLLLLGVVLGGFNVYFLIRTRG
jgi:ATP synthase protein I